MIGFFVWRSLQYTFVDEFNIFHGYLRIYNVDPVNDTITFVLELMEPKKINWKYTNDIEFLLRNETNYRVNPPDLSYKVIDYNHTHYFDTGDLIIIYPRSKYIGYQLRMYVPVPGYRGWILGDVIR